MFRLHLTILSTDRRGIEDMDTSNRQSLELVGFGEAMALLQPPAGETIESARGFELHVAGAELNLCAAAARAGIRTAWCSRVGTDPLGQRIRRTAATLGVEPGLVLETSDPTGLFVKEILSDGQRRVFYYRSGSAASQMDGSDADRLLACRPLMIATSGITMCLGAEPRAAVLKLARTARTSGMRFAFDPNLRTALGPLDDQIAAAQEILPWVDVLLLGIDEAATIFGSDDPFTVFGIADRIGVTEVVLKAGAEGCFVREDRVIHVPSAATDVVDPVGAGDALAGGYLAARIRGATRLKSAQFGSRLAAAVVSVSGDTEGLPPAKQVRGWLAQAVNSRPQ